MSVNQSLCRVGINVRIIVDQRHLQSLDIY